MIRTLFDDIDDCDSNDDYDVLVISFDNDDVLSMLTYIFNSLCLIIPLNLYLKYI
jgi:hypothetical protein